MVKFIDKNNTYISEEVSTGIGVVIYPNVTIEGISIIGDNTIIYPGCFIKNSIIGSNCEIYNSHIIDSSIGDFTIVGPYANVHNKVKIGNNNKVGSFVELKNTITGNNTKIPHLSYIGDAVIGTEVNIGAGAITANYDGLNKNKTVIKDSSFIGCNVNLVAPVEIGENALVAAGSTITKNVPANSLSIAREKQVNKKNYYKKNKV